jgi:hypothetical protein
MPREIKDYFEELIEAVFGPDSDNLEVVVDVPSEQGTTPVTRSIISKHKSEWAPDESRKQQEKPALILYSYPLEDQPYLTFAGEYVCDSNEPALQISPDPDSADVPVLISGSSQEIEFNWTEPNLAGIQIMMAKNGTDSTSRYQIELEQNGSVFFRRTYFPSFIPDTARYIKMIPVWKNSLREADGPIKLTISEWGSYGDNPAGFYIYKNNIDEFLIKIYNWEASQIWGQINKGIMRLEIIAESLDYDDLFCSGRTTVDTICNEIRANRHEFWHLLTYGIPDISATRTSKNPRETDWVVVQIMDFEIIYEDTVEIENFIVKEIEVNVYPE